MNAIAEDVLAALLEPEERIDAVADAVGVRITDLPITSEAVLRALGSIEP